MNKCKGVITCKDGNHYFIRFYGSSIDQSSGIDGIRGKDLMFISDTPLKIGDFVEIEYSNYEKKHICTKFKPLERDLMQNNALEEYLRGIAENGGLCYKEILLASRRKFLENPYNSMNIIFSDEQISDLITKYKSSVIKFGIAEGYGPVGYGLQKQLEKFKSFYKDETMDCAIMGIDTKTLNENNKPSCIANKYNVNCSWYGDIGNPKGNWYKKGSNYCIQVYGTKIFDVALSYDCNTKPLVKIQEYKKGKLDEAEKEGACREKTLKYMASGENPEREQIF